MYELDYQPERLDWNEYFVRYKKTGEIKYFKAFLHFYEPYLDRKVSQFIKRYELEDYRTEDLKQIFVAVLWEELQNYDSDMPLLQLIKYNVMVAWHVCLLLERRMRMVYWDALSTSSHYLHCWQEQLRHSL